MASPRQGPDASGPLRAQSRLAVGSQGRARRPSRRQFAADITLGSQKHAAILHALAFSGEKREWRGIFARPYRSQRRASPVPPTAAGRAEGAAAALERRWRWRGPATSAGQPLAGGRTASGIGPGEIIRCCSGRTRRTSRARWCRDRPRPCGSSEKSGLSGGKDCPVGETREPVLRLRSPDDPTPGSLMRDAGRMEAIAREVACSTSLDGKGSPVRAAPL